MVLRNKGTWEAIASDVSGIKTAVEGNKAETPDSYMGGISVDSLILLWNDVAQLGEHINAGRISGRENNLANEWQPMISD